MRDSFGPCVFGPAAVTVLQTPQLETQCVVIHAVCLNAPFKGLMGARKWNSTVGCFSRAEGNGPWSKGRVPALVLQKPPLEEASPTTSATHRHTQGLLEYTREASTDHHVISPRAGCVPSRVPMICTSRKHSVLLTISVFIGSLNTTSNYCQEHTQRFPPALMIPRTHRSTQPHSISSSHSICIWI